MLETSWFVFFVISCVLVVTIASLNTSTDAWILTISGLYDDKLCNNDHSTLRFFENYRCDGDEDHYNNSKLSGLCDARVENSCKCLEITAQFLTSDMSSNRILLDRAFSVFDSTNDTRRISLSIPVTNRSELFLWRKEIDDLLENRPWLMIQHESTSWDLSFAGGFQNGLAYFVVDKIRHDYEPYLRFLGSIEYLSERDCNASTMLMVTRHNFVHPGWAGVTSTVFLEHDLYRYATTMMYVSKNNDPYYSTGFIDATTCTNTANRWECAFYRTTNCSVPSPLSSCQEENCVSEMPSTDHFGVYFHQQQQIPRDEKNETNMKLLAEKFRVPKSSKQGMLFLQGQCMRPFRWIIGGSIPWKDGNTTLENPIFQPITLATREVLFIHQYLLRMNHYYRELVGKRIFKFDSNYVTRHKRLNQQIIHQMLHLPALHYAQMNFTSKGPQEGKTYSRRGLSTIAPSSDGLSPAAQKVVDSFPSHHHNDTHSQSFSSRFHSSSVSAESRLISYFPSCIGIHIRRGDRLGNSNITNISEYCAHENDLGSDYGCNSIPFALVQLQPVIDVARVMSYSLYHQSNTQNTSVPPIRTLFVSTDDEDWLKQQIKMAKKHPKYKLWEIVYLQNENLTSASDPRVNTSDPRNPISEEISEEFRFRHGTAAGVQLMASLALMQRCTGFIGHLDSNAALMFYQAMCLRHVSSPLPVHQGASSATASSPHRKQRPVPKQSPATSSEHRIFYRNDSLPILAKEGICPLVFNMQRGFDWLAHIDEQALLKFEASFM
jgi:hypothetical protein